VIIDAARVSSSRSTNILVVGGGSRAATAFRRYAATKPDLALTTLMRRPDQVMGREAIVQTTDYYEPPDDLLRAADVMINFTGITSGRNEELLRRVNVDGPLVLATHAKRNGIRQFVQLSSFHVYGYAEEISRSTIEMPITPYGRSKLAADRALLAMQSEEFTVTVFRLPILYGRYTGDNLRKLAALIARVGVFPVGPRRSIRSVLHVDNLAILLDEIVRSRSGGVRFGADPEPFTIHLLAEVIADRTGRKPRLAPLPDAAFLPLRLLSRGLYSRICRSNFVKQIDCVVPAGPFPVALRDGLKDILPQD